MTFATDDIEMIVRLLAALAAGAFIGYERSFHGRPAGCARTCSCAWPRRC